uniref:SDR family oxidoreductase n=1 Tax=uncultured Draconibacterium sp. TaxID=1573823 RepID=UPI0032169329
MENKRILLVGATGYLGKQVAKELTKHQYPTTILVRNQTKIPGNLDWAKIIVAEITKPETLSATMDDIDVLISTVGITKQKDGLTYMDVDYQANLNLLIEAKKAGVKKFIYVSAFNADRLTHLKMCHAKELFVQELINSGMDYCIIRPNGFFSDMNEFLKMAKKGKAELFGDGNYKMNPIHGEDLAEVCVNAIDVDEKTIEVGGPEVFTHKQIVELAFNTFNKKAKVHYMPEWIRKMILWFARTFTSSKTYGPMEFFFTVLAMDMIAPKYGKHTLSEFFKNQKTWQCKTQ